jgi:hypothetical protein
MASRRVNEAVVAYRKQTALEFNAEQARQETEDLAARLYGTAEFAEYVRLTQQIDRAVSQSEEAAESAQWSRTTRRQQFKIAVNAAGKDGA